MTAAAVATPTPFRLGPAVSRRSPRVADALDDERAWAHARAWAARAVPDATVEAVDVGEALYRRDGGCSLRYRVHLARTGREHILLVEVTPSGEDLVVRPFPADPALPTLRQALDPALMREVLGRVVPGTGGDRAIGRCSVDVVRYPRQGRCVLRYRLSPGAGGAGELRHPVLFGKVYADGTASVAARALRLLAGGLRPLPDDGGVTIPRPLAVVPPLRLGLAEAIPGMPLLPRLIRSACSPDGPSGSDRRALVAATTSAARLAAGVHRCPLGAGPLPERDLAGERAAVERDLVLLDEVWPDVAAHLRHRLAAVLATLDVDRLTTGGRWPSTRVLAHGDFTPGQVLLDDTGNVGLVDVDTLCVAEPAADLGRFLAYLHVSGIRRSRTAEPLLTELAAHFLEAYVEAYVDDSGAPAGVTPQDLRPRVAAYRALNLARLGASACWQLKDDRLAAVIDAIDAIGAGNDG